MPTFDLRGVILLAGFLAALMSVVIYFMKRSYPPSVEGLGHWAGGPAIIFVSTLLFGTRGVLPDLFTVVIANLLLMGGVVLLYVGSGKFYKVRIDPRPWLVAIVGIGALLVVFGLIYPNYNMRLLLVASFMAAVFASHALLVARQRGTKFSARYVLAVLITEALVLVLRAVSALTTESDGLLQSSPIQTIYIAAYAIVMLMLTVGLILLATDRLREELEYLATHDPLTGVLNRRAFMEAAELELARCRRHGHVMSILLMDLDHFKQLNDTHGHLVGDQVLRDLVERIAPLLRRPDRLGRFGGEEFILLLPETNRDAAAVVAERIRAAVEAADKLPPYTVSIGVACNVVSDAGLDPLLARADTALYEAKEGGRNRVVLAPALQKVA
jgi:diguanylate cyclase (GGDEF)-like protein